MKKVFVAEKYIPRGSRLERKNFSLEKQYISKINGDIIEDWDIPIINSGSVNIPLEKGDILTHYYLVEKNFSSKKFLSNFKESPVLFIARL